MSRRGAALALALALGACSWIDPRDDDPTVAYTRAGEAELLEVPPDVSGEFRTGLLRIPEDGRGDIGRATLLPEPQGIRAVRDGRVRWLEMETDPRELWPALKDFWRQQGFAIARDEPLLGIMETAWRDRREDVGEDTGVLSKVFGDSYTESRARYRVRLERIPDDEGRVRLFLSQRLATEEVLDDAGGRQVGERVYLQRRADSEREQEMLARLLVYFGIHEQRARGILSEEEVQRIGAPAYIEEVDGQPTLVVADAFQRVWRLAAVAIEDIGLDIEKTVPTESRYEVLYAGALPEGTEPETAQPKGFFGRLFGSDDVEHYYQLYVLEEPGRTRISIADATGTSRVPALERQIMRRLQAEFR